jgi:octaprenyl-diphosphate synthase
MEISTVRELVADDLDQVNAIIRRRLASDVVLINEVGRHIIDGGGKRLRPIVLLLAARACGYTGSAHYDLAAVIEFIHTATLLHDDVVDASELRRGQETANHLFGNEASVLVGDFLYSRAFQMMVDVDSMRVMRVLADATNVIAEGEVMQLLNCHDPDISEDRYLHTIRSKTAKLFEAAAQLGGILGGQREPVERGLIEYGARLGTAFQLVDDVLDYSADTAAFGKNIGDDLAEGKPTLPLIHTMKTGSPDEVQVVRRSLEEGDRSGIETVVRAIESSGAIAYTQHLAEDEVAAAQRALEPLPAGIARDALIALADFAVRRTH